jgi:hypothetical protein
MRKFIGVIFIALFGVSLLFFAESCKHENLPNINADSICFERDILPIFVSNCAMSGCHDAITSAEGYDLSNYSSIMKEGIKPGNPSDSEIWEVIDDGSMPPKGKLTSLQRSYIKTWIAAGAKNGINCFVNCDSNVITYSAGVSKIMSQCTGCHSGTNPSGKIDLSNAANVKTIALTGRLVGSVQQLSGYISMPPYGSPKLSDCQITQIQKWMNNGCQND